MRLQGTIAPGQDQTSARKHPGILQSVGKHPVMLQSVGKPPGILQSVRKQPKILRSVRILNLSYIFELLNHSFDKRGIQNVFN